MKLTPLVIVPLMFLAGCVGQGAQHQDASQEELGVIFSVPDASFTLTAECTRHAEVEHDEAGRPMVVVSMQRSPECSEKAFDAVFSKKGQRLTVEYKNQVLVESSLIVTPVDPTSPTWLGVESDALAHEISSALN